MAPLMIVNPRRRRKAAKKKQKRRKMTAKQLKFFGPRKGKKKRKRAKTKVIVIDSNPKGAKVAKKKRRHRKHKKVFAHNPRRAKRRRFRRNPRSIEAGFINNTLMPAAIGAAGAIGADMLLQYVPIPAQLRQGFLVPVLKIAAALLVGAAVGAISNKSAGEEAAAGGVIVTLYGIAKGFQFSSSGGGMARYTPMRRYAPMRGLPPGALKRPGGGGNMRGLGYANPARIGPGAPTRANMRYLASR